MKAVLSFLLCLFISFSTSAQLTPGYFNLTIERSTAPGDSTIAVKITPTGTVQALAGATFTDMSFTITWPSTYTVDLGTPSSLYGIIGKGPKYTTGAGGVNFRSYGLTGPYVIPADWAVGTAVTIMTIIPRQNVATAPAVGDFSINPFNTVLTQTPFTFPLALDPFVSIDRTPISGFPDFEEFEMAIVGGAAISVVLPLELLTFDAKAGKDAIDLRWKTAKEENFRGFNIERSLDGKKYTSVAFQAGKNAKGADYTFTDRNVVNGQVYYYRLRMIDNDGKNSVSDIRSAVLQGAVVASTGVNIYPNPTNGDVNLDFILDADTHTVVDLFDVTGKNVLHKEVEAKRDRNIISLEMLNMASGIYAVRINMGGKITNKLVKVAKQ